MKSGIRNLAVLGILSASSHAMAQGTLDEAMCNSLADSLNISVSDIGEPVSGVVIDSVTWVSGEPAPAPAGGPGAGGPGGPGGPGGGPPGGFGGFGGGGSPAVHCRVDGQLLPVSTAATARPIKFGVALPPEWNGRSIQMGGGGMNGSVPGIAGRGPQSDTANGYVTYGSDSGHANGDDEWALNDEAIRNLGHQQMKKTHDAAMAIMKAAYGSEPEYNYYVGGSQGGREALTVVQRYPDDYEGVLSTVPIVGFSSLMTGPTRMRIQEKAVENWITPAKNNSILAEFMSQCDGLDGLVDGVMNNYVDCRAIFNVNDGKGPEAPWADRMCPGNVDPDPADTSINACLTAGQIETLHLQYSDLDPGIDLPNGRTNFGMWAPATAIVGGGFGGLFTGTRYKGQEGAAADAPVYSTLGSIGIIGFYMEDVNADPLEFNLEDHGERWEQLAPWLDSTQSDLSAYAEKGGKLIVIVGSDDTIAPSGEQLNYYQTVLDTMGRNTVDDFARLFVLPQTGHGLSGSSATIDGDGNTIEAKPIPASTDRFALLSQWVEEGIAPAKTVTVTNQTASLPMCSYPQYPHYEGGDINEAGSYSCNTPVYAE